MPTSFRPYDPDQSLMFPPNPREWLPEDHLVFFVSDTIDALDLSRFYAPYEGDGRRNQPYEPSMMLKVLVYAYATGTFSSRKIARRLEEDVAFRVLGSGNFPAHRTIADFRQRHLEDFQSLFVQVVRIAGELGLVKLGTVAVDGSKVKANASKHKAMSYKRMVEEEKRLRREILELTKRARKTDEREDARYGAEMRGDELPEEIAHREGRLAKIRAAKQRLEARQREADRARGRGEDDDQRPPGAGRPFKQPFGVPKDKAQENFTDPDSRIMKCTSGFEQCYNAQIAVDAEAHLIVATGVTQQAADTRELRPVLDAVRANTGKTPQKVLADAGYVSEENLRSLKRRRIDGYLSLGRGEKDSTRKPTGKLTQEMQRKMRTKRAQERYRKRKGLAEPPFGWIKSVIGFQRFSLRGLAKATGEWNLVCLAVDLRRLSEKMVWA